MRCLLALCLLAAGPAWGGAWPRPPGEVFLSLRFDRDQPAQGEASNSVSAYGEYGLSARWTLIGQFSNSTQPWTPSRAAIGLNFALSTPDATNRWAVGFGVSTPPDVMGAMMEARGEVSLHWGRGFESRWGGGWATATFRALYGMDTARPITDVSALVGLRPREGWMVMLSAGRYEDDEGTYIKATPSLGYELRPKLWLVPHVMHEFTDDRSTGVGVSVWWSF